MAKKPSLIQVLKAAEDFLLMFDSYFRDPVWVTKRSGFTQRTIERVQKLLEEKEKSDLKGEREFPALLSLVRSPWDKKWRMVNFDIPEKQRKTRDEISYLLKKWGFKPYQRSAWISPLPVDERIEKLLESREDPLALSMLSGQFLKVDSKQLVAKLWETYNWEQSANKLITKAQESNLSDDQFKKKFWALVLDHPRVPLDLLSADWPLEKMVDIFLEKFK